MNFSSDRDLLAVEPNVFRDVLMSSQQRVRVSDGAINGTVLSSDTADFAAAGVEGGWVVLINGVACEVIGRIDSHSLQVSLLRGRGELAAIPPGDLSSGGELEVVVRTFGQQASLVHDLLLRLAGVEGDEQAGGLTEQAIVSQEVMKQLEVLGTLELVYWGAAAFVGENSGVRQKAELYRRRFNEALRGAAAEQAAQKAATSGDRRDLLRYLRLRRGASASKAVLHGQNKFDHKEKSNE